MEQQKYADAKGLFDSIPDYRDAAAQSEACEIARKNSVYAQAWTRMKKDTIDELAQAAKLFKSIPGWKDADEKANACRKRVSEIEAQREAERLKAEQKAEREAEENRIAEEKRRKKKKTTGLIVALLVIAAVAAFFVWTKVIQPKLQYDKAVALYNAGKYGQAITAFEALDGYKDRKSVV